MFKFKHNPIGVFKIYNLFGLHDETYHPKLLSLVEKGKNNTDNSWVDKRDLQENTSKETEKSGNKP